MVVLTKKERLQTKKDVVQKNKPINKKVENKDKENK